MVKRVPVRPVQVLIMLFKIGCKGLYLKIIPLQRFLLQALDGINRYFLCTAHLPCKGTAQAVPGPDQKPLFMVLFTDSTKQSGFFVKNTIPSIRDRPPVAIQLFPVQMEAG